MIPKRITLFAGHYGSGKTNIAVNFTLRLAREGKRVTLGDLDIVNPYYRAKDSEEALRAAGVRVIASAYANSNVDVPALPQEMYALTEDLDSYAVMDIGGDDRGALALGRYMPAIARELEQADAKASGFIMMAASPRPLDVLMREQYNFLYSLMPEVTEEQQAEKDRIFAELDRLKDLEALTDDDTVLNVHAP